MRVSICVYAQYIPGNLETFRKHLENIQKHSENFQMFKVNVLHSLFEGILLKCSHFIKIMMKTDFNLAESTYPCTCNANFLPDLHLF